MPENKILEGLRDAIDGDMNRATFYGIDYGTGDMSAVSCPRCDAPNTWSAPDPAPEHCWQCGLEFKFR